MAFELAGPVIQRANLVLTGVELMSLSGRAKDNADYVKIRAGIRYKSGTDWLSTVNTSKNSLVAGSPVTMYDEEKRLLDGAFPVVEITLVGTPATLVGSSVTFHYAMDGSSRGRRRALVGVAASDQATRSLVDQINASGLGESSVQIQLNDG